jgi:carbonic anhydrase
VEGEALPLELHMVHQGVSDPAATLVVSLLFNESTSHNAAFDAFFWDIHHSTSDLMGISLNALVAQMPPVYLRYTGSLTTPPCTGNVTWLVFLSRAGVNPLQALVYEYALNGVANSRLAQPRNQREVAAWQR